MKLKIFQPENRVKLLRVLFIVSVVLVILAIFQLIFESPGNFEKVMNWFVLILWTIFAVLNWFQFKKAREQFRHQSDTESPKSKKTQ